MAKTNLSSDSKFIVIDLEIKAGNKLSIVQFDEVVDTIIASALESHDVDWIDQKSSKIGQEFDIDNSTVKTLINYFCNVVKDSFSKGMKEGEFRVHLEKSGMDPEKIDSLLSKWRDNYSDLKQVAQFSVLRLNRLVDVDWKFGVVASSSELSKIGSIFIQLRLTIAKDCDTTDTVTMELTLQQFYSFLREMEKAKASLEYYL